MVLPPNRLCTAGDANGGDYDQGHSERMRRGYQYGLQGNQQPSGYQPGNQKMILEVIAERKEHQQIILPAELVVRDSTGPCAG